MSRLKEALLGDVPYVAPPAAFGGSTYVPERDYLRLKGQLKRVYDTMKDGEWWTDRGLAFAVGCTEGSAAARRRDLRKEKYGSHEIERRHIDGGLFEYRMKS